MQLALSFRSLAYRDYIASRVLLNNGHALQGLTLASSAVEKYIKIALVAKGLTSKQINGHMNRLPKLQNLLAIHYIDFTQNFDTRFLELLGKAYDARYFDDLKSPLTIGFFIGQVLCELDFAVDIMERVLNAKDGNGKEISSPYKRAALKGDQDLIYNNFIFLKISKKDFMEKIDQGFAVYIDPINGYKEIEAEGLNICNKYDGQIADINFNFK